MDEKDIDDAEEIDSEDEDENEGFFDDGEKLDVMRPLKVTHL